eukprot:TRINITY_DN24211_c0_g1_i1.p1 TRINITY_DN24211_c0_g1~~TRINITY_DN24211_c0_g1_i1.p1  ORF type:complete len:117 (-),score=13.03 TRINITY_DN24211_c0_g1_i1:219-569(-)
MSQALLLLSVVTLIALTVLFLSLGLVSLAALKVLSLKATTSNKATPLRIPLALSGCKVVPIRPNGTTLSSNTISADVSSETRLSTSSRKYRRESKAKCDFVKEQISQIEEQSQNRP